MYCDKGVLCLEEGKRGDLKTECEIVRESHPSWQIREDQASTQSELSKASLSFSLSHSMAFR